MADRDDCARVMPTEFLVVGLDTDCNEEVFVEDASVDVWRIKSYKRGNGSLICLHCFRGCEAPPGTRVPLVVRYREGGSRRAHFAHPPGMAPPKGHAPETLWHSEGKHLLARWAATLPNVISAVPERYSPDQSRRADVAITLRDNTRLAIELQYRLLHDADWVDRHKDYQANDVVDIWLWRHTLPTPWVVHANDCAMWFLDLAERTIGTEWGQPHERRSSWYTEKDLGVYIPHWPACRSDKAIYRRAPWAEFTLDKLGLQQPDSWTSQYAQDLDQIDSERDTAQQVVRENARAARERAIQREQEAASLPPIAALKGLPLGTSTGTSSGIPSPGGSGDAPREGPPWEVPRGVEAPRCDLCGIKLARMWWDTGRHGDCEEQRLLKEQRRRSRRSVPPPQPTLW